MGAPQHAEIHKPKDWDDLAGYLKDQGWELELTATGTHTRAKGPRGGIVHFSSSKDPHALMNTVAACQKFGFQWPPPVRPKPILRNEDCPRCGKRSWDPVQGNCLRSGCPSNAPAIPPPRLVPARLSATVGEHLRELQVASSQGEDLSPDSLDQLLDDVRAAKELLIEARTKAQDTAAILAKAQKDFEEAKAGFDAAQRTFDEAKVKLVKELDE